ncbi:Nramp family divalent metal transporter [Roseomonas chloroacetimidivorans]|uniref:Nramp family divalent metal transporter n=1 Tax=Roseomonas chloroacetimidivorans TaxID=1766656 RepID=UPI003C72F062
MKTAMRGPRAKVRGHRHGAQPAQPDPTPRGILRRLGPGLVTGAADDDPSGIATYSQVGAQAGFALGWTMVFSYPLMIAVQEACARIGFATGRGIAENLRRTAHRPVLYGAVLLLLAANLLNLAADLSAMAAAARMVLGGPVWAWLAGFAVFSIGVPTALSYARYAAVLKWLCIVLAAYPAVVLTVRLDWGTALASAAWPHLPGGIESLMALVAVLGTTISPYLFFWQSAQEVAGRKAEGFHRGRVPRGELREALARIRMDTLVGMAVSNLVALCIIWAAAMTLHAAGQTDVGTAEEAAAALRPVAGGAAVLVFALGIVGTGLLAVPALAGSMAYAVAETFGWRTGLDRKPLGAPAFYAAMAVAVLVAAGMGLFGLDPIRALYWSSVANGLLAPPLMAVVIRMASNERLMGAAVLPTWLRRLGWAATAAMTAAAVALLGSWVLLAVRL